MEIRYAVIMFRQIPPDLHGMTFFAVEGPVHELDLGYPALQEKGKFFLNQIHSPETDRLIQRRKAVAAGKGAAPAAFIINDPMLHPFHILIGKGKVIEIHKRCRFRILDPAVPSPVHDSRDMLQRLIPPFFIQLRQPRLAFCLLCRSPLLFPETPKTGQKTAESLLPFPFHHQGNLGKTRKKPGSIIGNFRASQPDPGPWKDLGQISNQLLYIVNIPDIAGKSCHIRLSPV